MLSDDVLSVICSFLIDREDIRSLIMALGNIIKYSYVRVIYQGLFDFDQEIDKFTDHLYEACRGLNISFEKQIITIKLRCLSNDKYLRMNMNQYQRFKNTIFRYSNMRYFFLQQLIKYENPKDEILIDLMNTSIRLVSSYVNIEEYGSQIIRRFFFDLDFPTQEIKSKYVRELIYDSVSNNRNESDRNHKLIPYLNEKDRIKLVTKIQDMKYSLTLIKRNVASLITYFK